MKTHELANALSQLAKALRAGPNIELGEINLVSAQQMFRNGAGSVAVNLHTLLELSSIDKRQWLALIEEHNFPISVRPRDASRDILGKLLSYLEQNSDAREKLRNSISHKASKASPELMRALGTLLKE